MQNLIDEIKRQFVLNFISDDRWRFLLDGLAITLRVTFFALIFGIMIGIVVAIVRSTYEKNYVDMRPGLGRLLLMF